MDLREPLDDLISKYPVETLPRFPRRGEIRLYDTTLRDGEQAPGVAFSPKHKAEAAVLLSEAGLHILDVGFPAASEAERLSLGEVIDCQRSGRIRADVEILATCRANDADIDLALKAVADAGAPPSAVSLFVFTSASDLHLKYKIGRMLVRREGFSDDKWLDLPIPFFRAANLGLLSGAIARARSRGVETVEFGGEDGSRADIQYLLDLASAGYRAGGTRFSFPDTVGSLTPEGVDYYIPRLVGAFPGRPLVVHFHNDFGLAAYNTIRALQHGATIPACTVNGLGERAGNAALHTVVTALRDLYDVRIPGFRYENLRTLSQFVERISEVPIGATEPVVGNNAFRHESALHVAGLLTHPSLYQAIDPASVGFAVQFVFGKHSSEKEIGLFLQRHEATFTAAGISLSEQLIRAVTQMVGDTAGRAASERAESRGLRLYYEHLESLGLSEKALLTSALSLGRQLTAENDRS